MVTYEPHRWLRLEPVIRCRQKLATWSKDDVLALAAATFGHLELTKAEVSQLLMTLKKSTTKPDARWYVGLPQEEGVAANEIRWVDNGTVDDAETTHFDLGAGRVVLRFQDGAAATHWACTLLDQDVRKPWEGLVKLWRRWTKLSGFHLPHGFDPYPLSPAAAKAVAKVCARDQRETTPLPDNGTLVKRYWGLEVGEVLTHPEKSPIVVTGVRLNLGSPPTITFQSPEVV